MKKFVIIMIIFIVGAGLGLMVYFGNGTGTKKVVKRDITPIEAARQFNATNALDFAGDVCNIGPRCNGNPGELKAASLMATELEKYGLNVTKEKVDLGEDL